MSHNSEPGETELLETKEKPSWRHSPFASAEIGTAVKAPEFLVHLPHAMAWDPDADKEYLLGQLLASAVLHGALICESVWQSWVEGLAHHQEEDELLWVEMDLGDKRGSGYRWFADPTTRILIIKWRILHISFKGLSARHCLQSFFARISQSSETQDRVSLFANWAVMHWRLRLPPLLLDQALCRLPTTTLSNKVWLEVLGTNQKPVQRPWNGHLSRSTFAASMELLETFNSKGSIESKIFEEAWSLRSKGAISRRKEKNLCIRQLTAALPGLSPGRQTLVRWAIDRLTQKRARPSPKGFAPFTVRQWLYSILEGLYAESYINNADFEVSPDGISDDVKKVLGKLGEQKEQLIKAAQKDFDRYVKSLKPVRAQEGAEEALEAFFTDASNSPVDQITTVSAKIISPRLFYQAVERARDWSSDDQAALIITLGFRAGMRFNEIAGLQVHDFIIKDNDIFELHLQRNRHRQLKTFDSRRILPLDILLTTHEQIALRRWLEPRRKRAMQIGKNVYCFGPAESRTPIPDTLKFIEKILNHKKKGDEGREQYNFAHLRHSFGSYLLASLLLPEETESSLLPEAFRGVVCWSRKEILSDRLLGQERLGQAALHAVSQIMGHTGIYRTLESYQHLLDLVLGLFVSREALQPGFPVEVHSSLRVKVSAASQGASAAFGSRGRNLSRRSRPRSGGYTVPVPPIGLTSTTSDFGWHCLDLRHATASYGLTPLRSKSEDTNKYVESGGRLNPWHARFPALSKESLDWKTAWTIVTSRDDHTKELRESLGLCNETLRTWRHRHQEVMTWGFKRQGKRQTEEACLLLPIGAPALSMVEWMWIRRRSGEIPASRHALIKTYLSNFNCDGFYSRMPSLEGAAAFAAFLRQVGVDGRNITIAQGKLTDFTDIKSGKTAARDVLDDDDKVLYRTWAAPGKFLLKPQNDCRPALWISHIKHEDPSLGCSFDMARTIDGVSPPQVGRRFPQHKVNYAYRFALAMMAIVDDEVWDNPD